MIAKMQSAIAEGKSVGGMDLGGLLNDDLPTQLDKIAEAVSKIGNVSERNNFLKEIFGKSGRGMAAFFKDGAAGMSRMRQEAAQVYGITGDEVDRLDRIGDAWSKILGSLGSIIRTIGGSIFGSADQAEAVAGSIIGMAAAVRGWIQENAGLVQTIAAIVAGVTAIGAALAAAGVSMILFSASLSAAGVIFSKLFLAKLFFFSGLAAVIATIVVLFREFTNLGSEFGKSWDYVQNAVKNGQLELAFKIMFKTIKLEFFKLVKELTEGFSFVALSYIAAAVGFARGGPIAAAAAELAAMTAMQAANNEASTKIDEQLAELEALRAQVGNATGKAKNDMAAAVAAMSALGGPTKGAFGTTGNLAQQLGVNDQVKTLKSIDSNTKKTADGVEKLKGGEWAP